MTTAVAVNIPHTLGPRAAAHDAELAFDMAGPEGVVYGCEIDDGNDGPFDDAAHPTHRVRFRSRRTQVAHPASWRNLEPVLTRIVKAPKLWSNPGRDLNAVFDYDARTVDAAIHAPNRRNGKPFARLSQAKNKRYHRRVARKVQAWRDGGWNVRLGGDGNDLDVYEYHPEQVVAAHAGLMWIVAVPARGKYVQVRNVRVNRNNRGDHPIVAAEVTFQKGPR